MDPPRSSIKCLLKACNFCFKFDGGPFMRIYFIQGHTINLWLFFLLHIVHILKKKKNYKNKETSTLIAERIKMPPHCYSSFLLFFYWLFGGKCSPIDTHTLMSFANYEYRWTKLPFHHGRQPTSQRDSTQRPHFNFKNCSYAILLEVNSLFRRFSYLLWSVFPSPKGSLSGGLGSLPS